MNKVNIFLDDVRTPEDNDWLVVRNYDEFVKEVSIYGLESIESISFDHDLADINYNPLTGVESFEYYEKTGYDCAKWLVSHYYDMKLGKTGNSYFPQIYVHSANPVGSDNIVNYINNFLTSENLDPTCVRVNVRHTVH